MHSVDFVALSHLLHTNFSMILSVLSRIHHLTHFLIIVFILCHFDLEFCILRKLIYVSGVIISYLSQFNAEECELSIGLNAFCFCAKAAPYFDTETFRLFSSSTFHYIVHWMLLCAVLRYEHCQRTASNCSHWNSSIIELSSDYVWV